MFKRLFLEHPHSLGETYFQHQKQAIAFGCSMIRAGCACLVHALVLALCVHTGSRAVALLHDYMERRAHTATALRCGGGHSL
jgi:hypothetical protein